MAIPYGVSLDTRRRLQIVAPFEMADLLRRLPDSRMWDAKTRCWRASPSRVNIEYLRTTVPSLLWDPDAKVYADAVLARSAAPTEQPTDDHRFADPPPWAHQRKGFALSRGAPAYALLMEQRTGKCRVLIDTANDLFRRSQIDAVVVICPNNVKPIWAEEEIPAWTPPGVPFETILYRSGKRKEVEQRWTAADGSKLQWLVINVEALSTKIGYEWLAELLEKRRVLGIVDEATRIKSPTALRSKHVVKLRPLFLYRRIATGTLVTQGPLDVYMPFQFLDPAILGYASFYTFRNEYAIFGGWNQKQVVGYVNTDRLASLIAPFSFRVLREQCFDLPPKRFGKRYVELSDEQRRLYTEMKEKMSAELVDPTGQHTVPVYDDATGEQIGTAAKRVFNVTMVLTQMLRLQQIIGGFLPSDDPENTDPINVTPIPGPNPKLEALLDELEECSGKSVIWARFRPEIALIVRTLKAKYGEDSVVEYHGGVTEEDRQRNRSAFQAPESRVRFLVGNPSSGGIGVPMHTGRHCHYFSNSFSLEDRLQSEDRLQNLSKRESVDYVDYLAHNTQDLKVIATLRAKKKLADVINRDNWKEWI